MDIFVTQKIKWVYICFLAVSEQLKMIDKNEKKILFR